MFILILLIPFNLSAQKWVYKLEKNAFDGDYKYAYITGKGGEFPYHQAKLVVNYYTKSSIANIYIADAGYAGCDNAVIYFKFDNNENIMSCLALTNDNKDVWFFSFENNETIQAMLNILKTSKTLNVRLKSDCSQADYEFSLIGSTTAINFVCKEFFEEIKQKTTN